jgi:DNA-binding LytR/AlgR family response regulator
MINCIIVDDDQFSVDAIKQYANRIPFLKVAIATTSSLEASRVVYEQPIDLVFTDVFMPEMDGVELVQMLGNKCKVIFITAYTDYAVQGYEHGVIDYLVKPVTFEKFLKAAQKAEKLIELEKGGSIKMTVNQLVKNFMMVKTEQKGKLIKVNFEDILFIEGAGNYVKICLESQEKIMTLLTFKALEDMLPQEKFMRVNKSYIVPIQLITGVEGNMVKLGDLSVPIGGTYKDSVSKLFVEKLA